jgi:hypothetical protein
MSNSIYNYLFYITCTFMKQGKKPYLVKGFKTKLLMHSKHKIKYLKLHTLACILSYIMIIIIIKLKIMIRKLLIC